MSRRVFAYAATALLLTSAASRAAFPKTVPAKAPDSLVLLFDSGSAAIRPQDEGLLDRASRLYRDGQPLVMIVSGATDLTGNPGANLRLSQQRADNVVQGLVARGIPVARFQIIAEGATAPAIPTPPGVAEPGNRRVEVTWR